MVPPRMLAFLPYQELQVHLVDIRDLPMSVTKWNNILVSKVGIQQHRQFPKLRAVGGEEGPLVPLRFLQTYWQWRH